MKLIRGFQFTLIVTTLILLFIGCSKNDEAPSLNNNKKTNTINDKVFTDNPFGYLFSNNNGSSEFVNGSTNTNFTGSNIPYFGGISSTGGSGSFTYASELYPLKYGSVDNFGDGWFYLIFLDVPISSSEEPQNYHGIAFEIRSGLNDEITNGDYQFSMSENPYTFDFGIMGVHLNSSLEEQYTFTSGTISITKSGGIYSFYFAGLLQNGKTVSGYFNGPLSNLDPEPNPAGYMTAKVNGLNWNASLFYAEIDDSNDVLIIYGGNIYGENITLSLLGSQKKAYFEKYGIFYPSNDPNIYIIENTGTNISGTFSFSGYDWVSNTGSAIITDGVFYNVPFIEK